MDRYLNNLPSDNEPSASCVPREPPWLQEATDYFWWLVDHDLELERRQSPEYELLLIGYNAGGEPVYIPR